MFNSNSSSNLSLSSSSNILNSNTTNNNNNNNNVKIYNLPINCISLIFPYTQFKQARSIRILCKSFNTLVN